MYRNVMVSLILLEVFTESEWARYRYCGVPKLMKSRQCIDGVVYPRFHIPYPIAPRPYVTHFNRPIVCFELKPNLFALVIGFKRFRMKLGTRSIVAYQLS